MAIHSPEFLRKKRERRKKVLIVVSVTFLVLLGLSIFLAHRPGLLVSEIQVEGNTVTSDSEVVSLVEAHLRGKYLLVYPRANSFIYPRRDVREALQREIPRLSGVELEVVGSRTLLVLVSERKPHALYCEDISSISDPRACYFLDENGYIFSTAPSFSGAVYFLYTSEVLVSEPLSSNFMPADRFGEVRVFIDRLRVLGMEPRAFVDIPSREEYYVILDNGGKLVLGSGQDLGKAVFDLQAFLANESISSQENFIDRVQQIDLSIENKVRWRMKEEVRATQPEVIEE